MMSGKFADTFGRILKANTTIASSDGARHMAEKHRYDWAYEDKRKANLDNVAKDIRYKTLDKNMFTTNGGEKFKTLARRCSGDGLTTWSGGKVNCQSVGDEWTEERNFREEEMGFDWTFRICVPPMLGFRMLLLEPAIDNEIDESPEKINKAENYLNAISSETTTAQRPAKPPKQETLSRIQGTNSTGDNTESPQSHYLDSIARWSIYGSPHDPKAHKSLESSTAHASKFRTEAPSQDLSTKHPHRTLFRQRKQGKVTETVVGKIRFPVRREDR
ncbi:hypothetical protein F511_31389 [Dorcoceras hygrometricum]|uniref:Uncharacterized protein n=1 Tax=Dorcoceras hygrometricum TaxID=472368 RepID=A0A2Z7BCE3_9LAMI|nr:hypothetical protein F511_31389 [Dorcoceras hygrometricum]